MSLKVVIEPKIIKFDKNILEQHRKIHGNANGFGENLVTEYLKQYGYKSIHHDYNLLGGNRQGKDPEAERILKSYFGVEKYEAARKFSETLWPFRDLRKATYEEPDLLVYKEDLSELKFVEVKNIATKDRLRKKQVRGLLLLSCFLNVDVDVFILVPNDKQYENKQIVWEFPTDILEHCF